MDIFLGVQESAPQNHIPRRFGKQARGAPSTDRLFHGPTADSWQPKDPRDSAVCIVNAKEGS